MPAKLTLYPSRGASRHYIFRNGESPAAGRDPACRLPLDDARVSAWHARFEWNGSGWTIFDSQSKNGTFVNGAPAAGGALESGDWISFGGLLVQFERVSEDEVTNLEKERIRRLQTSVELLKGLGAGGDPAALLRRLMESVLAVAGAERGFVLLLGPEGRLSARVASGFSPGEAVGEFFDGSFGAIHRVFETGKSVVASDARADAYLGKRPSVIEMGIGALACVPLRAEGAIAGIIYVDGRKSGGRFTDLDLEILEALADHAALVVAGMRLDGEIRELLGSPARPLPEGRPRFLEEMERRIVEIARSARPAEGTGRAQP